MGLICNLAQSPANHAPHHEHGVNPVVVQLLMRADQDIQQQVCYCFVITGWLLSKLLHLVWYLHWTFSRKSWVSWQQKGRIILHFNEARAGVVAMTSVAPYASHLHLASDITMPAAHHSDFWTAKCSSWSQVTVSLQWRQGTSIRKLR